ncbi:MAG: HAD-IC family P-type ATPase, partial [Rhodococcus sp. (in: high G+C Gram-positive bacteria)]
MSFSVLALRPRPTRNSAQQAHSTVLAKESAQELVDYSASDTRTVLADLTTTANGLRDDQIDDLRRQHGRNDVRHDRPAPAIVQFAQAFKNPFILILVFLALIMVGTDVVWADPEDGPSYEGIITLGLMIFVSVSLRFWQEYRSSRAAEALKAMVTTTVAATRKINNTVVTAEIPIEQLLPGDVVQLAAGDMIPADVRIIRAKDLQVNQSMLSGESMPAEKSAEPSSGIDVDRLLEAENIGFMGTSVVSGSGTAVAVHTGKRTYFGAMTAQLASKRPETSFDVGVRSVSYLLIKFMLIMVPAVFVINGLTKDWSQALLFGVATAVGLTPEMLPLIVTANLAKGALHMSRKKVIVKQINAIQNFGAMDVLCTDKTGTLTEDRIVLGEHLDTAGRKSEDVLRLAAVNSVNQTGLRSLLDDAVIEAAGPDVIEEISRRHGLVDESPFDFKRRRLSVVVDHGDADLIVTKGAVEELLSVCESV